MSEDGSNCLICHEPFLESAVGALKCGHVYHRNCVAIWFHQNSSNKSAWCPVCKKTAHERDMRTLDFDVKQLPAHSNEELRRLEAATLEDRERRREELATEKAEVEAVAAKVDAELAELREVSESCKRQRRELEQESSQYKEEYLGLFSELSDATKIVSAIRAGIDAEAPRLQRKLPIKQPKEGDSDLQEVRRKIKGGMRTAELARQLHEALTSALQQEKEKLRDKEQREAQSKEVEDELRRLRQHEVQLRRELEERRAASVPQVAASQLSTQASSQGSSAVLSTPTGRSSQAQLYSGRSTEDHQEPGQAAAASSKPSVEVATPHGVAELRLEEDEDMALLYGGGPRRRPLNSSGPLLANAGAATGGKWGAILGAGRGQSAASAKPGLLAGKTPQGVQYQQSATMKSLFANRRA